MNEPKQQLARLLRRRRGELHLSQAEAAALVGVSKRGYEDWEAARSWPRPAHLREIEKELGLQIQLAQDGEVLDERILQELRRLEALIRTERQ